MAQRSWIEEDQMDSESCCSDSGSIAGGSIFNKADEVSLDGMLRLNEEGDEYILLKHRFYLSIGPLAQDCSVVAAYRNLHTSSPMNRAQLEAFRVFMGAMAAKRNGNANVMHGWYGASKDELRQIMNGEGFRVRGMFEEGQVCGFGLHLCTETSANDSVLSAPVDDDGLRHLVVCRVILGRTEVILPGAKQFGPSSEDFDSGVDSQDSPSKFIVWYPDVKTHVLPLYALTIKLDSQSGGLQREHLGQPTTAWVPFTPLVYALVNYLPRSSLCMIRRFHTAFLERKITRQQFILRIRQLTGDKLLVFAIKEYQAKKKKAKSESIKKHSTGPN